MPQYAWKTNIFSSKITILRNQKNIGYFSINFFGGSRMELLNQSYRFKTTGFFGNTTEIYLYDESIATAIITFHKWNQSVAISYKNTTYQMRYNSIFSRRFGVFLQDKSVYTYKASISSGTMETENEDPLLIVLGMYAHIKRDRNY